MAGFADIMMSDFSRCPFLIAVPPANYDMRVVRQLGLDNPASTSSARKATTHPSE